MPGIRVLIEYLFKVFKQAVIKRTLPIYILQLSIFFATMYEFEARFKYIKEPICVGSDRVDLDSLYESNQNFKD